MYKFNAKEYDEMEVRLSDRVYVVCTKCDKVKPIKEVGLRNMGNGRIRNQAQCNECRGK